MAEKFIIQGKKKIQGEISVNGAKNFVLKALAATLLTEEEVIINNVPEIADVEVMLKLLMQMGVKIEKPEKRMLSITAENLDGTALDPEEARKVRTSVLFLGPILARQGKINLPHPGGDLIGKRPIDFFTEGLKKMGAKIIKTDSNYSLRVKGRLHGAEIFFPKMSVTGTETLVMAATLAKGTTILKNAAMEPEIVHLCNCLIQMGAKIKGAGTPTIEIEGVKKLKGGMLEVIPDRIETGTFIMMGVMNNAELLVKNCDPSHVEALWETLKKTGAQLEIGGNWVRTIPSKKRLKAVSIQTHEYPGFATDLQPIYTLLMTKADGLSLIHEPIFEGRLFFTDLLNRMGANIIMCDPHRVAVKGPTELVGKEIESPDIRAGITLILAGMMARGESIINNAQIVDRGYEDIEKRLQALGADIQRSK